MNENNIDFALLKLLDQRKMILEAYIQASQKDEVQRLKEEIKKIDVFLKPYFEVQIVGIKNPVEFQCKDLQNFWGGKK